MRVACESSCQLPLSPPRTSNRSRSPIKWRLPPLARSTRPLPPLAGTRGSSPIIVRPSKHYDNIVWVKVGRAIFACCSDSFAYQNISRRPVHTHVELAIRILVHPQSIWRAFKAIRNLPSYSWSPARCQSVCHVAHVASRLPRHRLRLR